MRQQLPAHLALITVNLIYGLNYVLAKDVMPEYVKPLGFIFLRGAGALLLFWLLHAATSRERIKKADLGRLVLCGLFGVAINQMLFFEGLNITTPINASIIMTSNPILVLLAAAFILRERLTLNKLAGIGLGLVGALLILLFKEGYGFGSSTALGDLFIFINAASYGIYLVMVKPLMLKYQPLTVIKWVFLFGFMFVVPFGWQQFTEIDVASMPTEIVLEVLYVIVCTTFLAYLLNIFALKKVSPTVVSAYIYLQPLIATIFAIFRRMDELSWLKVLAAVLIFAGVYLVSKPSGIRAKAA